MESPSQAPHSGSSLWKGFLLTASILSCWIQPTSAQSDSFSVVPNPPYGTVGSSVILDIQGLSQQPPSYTWYRKAVIPSNRIAFYHVANGQLTASDSRLNVSSNGSLSISNLTLSDTDDYFVQLFDPTSSEIVTAQGHLAVYETASKPTITANSTNVMENSTLVFTCNTEHEGMNILWFFNNKSLSLNEGQYLSDGDLILTVKNVTRKHAGSYQCEIWNPISSNRSDPLEVTVNYGPDDILFSPSPAGDEIRVIFQQSLTLVCQVESYPPAQYEWRVNVTVSPEFTNNTYIIQNVSWEDSGQYTCLAWNNVTELSVSKAVTVRVIEQPPEGGSGSSLSGGAIAGIVIGVIAGVALVGFLIYFLFFRPSGGASEHHDTEHKSSAPNHRQTNSDSSPNRTEEVSYASVNFNAQKPLATAQLPSHTDTVYSEIKKK
uniref:Ig-like domain-containing protein n=1 Tax=Vombatus ursinus TaxID=29139 RepID=A0A4X2KL35_VOMUR